MGCDIHVYFETLVDGKWRPTFGCDPDPKWWWSGIADDKLENGAADLVLNIPEDADYSTRHAVLKEYFEAIPQDEIVPRYGDHPKFSWTFNIPNDDGDWTADKMRISGRHYDFFGSVAKGVRRDYPDAFERRGIPDDVSPEVHTEIERMGDDGHSHSWLNVQEMLTAPNLQKFQHHLGYLHQFIPDPKNTRMVFYFDN